MKNGRKVFSLLNSTRAPRFLRFHGSATGNTLHSGVGGIRDCLPPYNRFQLGMIDGVEEFLQLFRRRVFVEQIAGDDHRLLRCLFQNAD